MLDCVGRDLGTAERLVDMIDVGVSWVGNEEDSSSELQTKETAELPGILKHAWGVCHK